MGRRGLSQVRDENEYCYGYVNVKVMLHGYYTWVNPYLVYNLHADFSHPDHALKLSYLHQRIRESAAQVSTHMHTYTHAYIYTYTYTYIAHGQREQSVHT
ncbi:hypothetical protein EON63_18825 [archaeon]|nr:MAG: hypothetical protein EON63_18825 [archaeon]